MHISSDHQLSIALGVTTILIVSALVPICVYRARTTPSRRARTRWYVFAAGWTGFIIACSLILTFILLGQTNSVVLSMQIMGLLGAITMAIATRLAILGERQGLRSQDRLNDGRRILREYQANLESMISDRTRALRSEINERRIVEDSLKRMNDHHERDLALAGELQMAMLSRVPRQRYFSLAVRYHPHSTVSGDTYVVNSNSEMCRIVLADAMGHGVAAALLTQVIQTGVQRFDIDIPGKDLLSDMNKLIASSGHMAYSTASHILIDRNGHLSVTGAGNPPPFICRASSGEILEIPSSGVPIGMFEELASPYETSIWQLHPGDRVYLYTDGITEWRNAEDEMTGAQRIHQFVADQKDLSLEASLDSIIRSCQVFANYKECDDDICLLALEYRGKV